MTLTEKEKYILDNEDFDVSDLGDVFEEKCSINLQEHITNSFAEEVQRHTFQLPTISSIEIKEVIKSLDEMKEQISNRVKTVLN